jgi:biotin carboxyl carrier protein
MKTSSVKIGERRYQVTVHDDGSVQIDGRQARLTVRRQGPWEYVVDDGRQRHLSVAASREGGDVLLQADGQVITAVVESERERLLGKFGPRGQAAGGSREVRAPMPSLVVKVEVAVGEQVKAGQGLMILEAMKMENEIKSSRAGTVKSIHVKPGNPVEKGALLLEFES